MIILAWLADFAGFLIVLIVALFFVAFVACLVVWGAAAAWRRFTGWADEGFGHFVAAELKGDPEPPASSEEAAAFAARLPGREVR